MSTKTPSDRDPVGSPTSFSPAIRSFLSLALFIHLFIVSLALAGNLSRSRFQDRLLTFFAPYTRPLNLDLNFTPYHLTHASPADVDHRIEWLPAGENPDDAAAWHMLPDRGWRGGERYKRFQRLAAVMSFFAEAEDNSTVGRLARDVAKHVLGQQQIEPKQVRVRKHMLQPMEVIEGGTADERDPNSDTYFREVYRANAIVTGDNNVDIIKVEDVGQVARPDAR